MSSILRSKIIDILNASVGQYCQGIDKDHISVSVFNGEVRISDVAIKQDCFIHHGLPFSPIDILMTDLVLDICDSDVDVNGDICRNLDGRALKAKEANLASDTVRRSALLKAQSGSSADNSTAELGRMRTLVAAAVKNLNCSLTNLTLRYTSRDGSSFIFHIDSVSLMNVDAQLKQAFLPVHAVTRKCCQVDGLSLTSCAATGVTTPVLEPLSTKLILSFENGAEARLLVGALSINVDSALVPVLVDIAVSGKLRIAQSRRAAERPDICVRGNARVWWRYVIACVKTMAAPRVLKTAHRARKISQVLKVYCGIYIKVLLGDDDADLLSRLHAIESDLHADLIFRFRDRCAAIVTSQGLLARKSQAASAARGGWFGKLLGAQPDQPFLLEQELQALAELSIAPDSHVLQHDTAQPAAAAAASISYRASVEFEALSITFWDCGCPSFTASVSKFSAGVSYIDEALQASCVLHRLIVSQHNASEPGSSSSSTSSSSFSSCIARSSLSDSDAAHQLVIRLESSPVSTRISGNVSGADVVVNAESLSLLSRWLDKARVVRMHSTRAVHAHGDSDSSAVSLKLVAMHIQRSPQIEVDFSWQAPTIKLQLASGTLCLVLGHITLTSTPPDVDALDVQVEPPELQSADPHFFSGAYPCPSAIYHRFHLSLIDFTLGLSDTHADDCQSHDSFQRIIAPTSAELSFAFVRGEFMDQNWALSQANAKCNSVSLEIRPRYCSAFNEAILMLIKLFSSPATTGSANMESDVFLSISSYSGLDDHVPAPSSASPALLLFVSNVATAVVRIIGHDVSSSDCSFTFSSSKTSAILRSSDTEAYMSVTQVMCCNNLLPATSPSYTILSVGSRASDTCSLLHFWYAEKGSCLWSDTAVIGSKRINRIGPSLGLSLDCADAVFNVDLFSSQGLLALISDNLDAFSASVKADLSRKLESLMTEVKQEMSSSGSTFAFEGNFSKLSTVLFSGADRVSVLSAELSGSAVKLLFSEGGAVDFHVSSDAFKIIDCLTSGSDTQHVMIESDSSQSLRLSGLISGDSLAITAAMSKFKGSLFAPAVAKIWCILFPPAEAPTTATSAVVSTVESLQIINISLDFSGADILFTDAFMSHSGFRLAAPSMRLSCNVQGSEATVVELLEGSDAFQIDAVVNNMSMNVVRSDGSMCLSLLPARNDLRCPIKTLSLYVSDKLLDYAFPFLRDVLTPAVSMFNPQKIVDKIIQQHAGKDFSITTGARSLILHLGDSSPTQLFVPLFDVRPLIALHLLTAVLTVLHQVQAAEALSKLDIVNETVDGIQARKISFEISVSRVDALYSFEGRQCTVLSCSKSSSNLFSFGGQIKSATQPSSYSGEVNLHVEPVLLQVDHHAFTLFVRIFVNVLSSVSAASVSAVSAIATAPTVSPCYSVNFNAVFQGLSVELALNETMSGRFTSSMAVTSAFSHDSLKIVSKFEDMGVTMVQLAVDGSRSTVQQLLESTFFNFSVKRDSVSCDYSVILSVLSPIVCNTSYMDIKRLYFTFELFLASFNSGIQSSRWRKDALSIKQVATDSVRSKANICFQADTACFVFVNDCPPFCAPLLELQISKLSLDACFTIGGGLKPGLEWLKLSTAVALNHCITDALSCDDVLPASKEIVFEEWSFAVSSQLAPNDNQNRPQLENQPLPSHCQHIKFEANNLLEVNISQACVMSLATAFARMHRDWTLWLRSKNASSDPTDSDQSESPTSSTAVLSRLARRFVFVRMRNETDVSLAVSHRCQPPVQLPPQSSISLDNTWTKLEFTLHANGSSKVCIITPVPILIEVGGAWIHVRSEEHQGQQFVVFRGSVQVFNHTSLPFSLAISSCASTVFTIAPRSLTSRFHLSSICANISGHIELNFTNEATSAVLTFSDETVEFPVESQLKGDFSTVQLHGHVSSGVLYVRLLPLFSISSSLPMPLHLLFSSASSGPASRATTVDPNTLVDICDAAFSRSVWVATDASSNRPAPVFAPLFNSAFAPGTVPSLAGSTIFLECPPHRHALSTTLRVDEVGIPIVSIFVAFIVRNCTHWPLDFRLSSKNTHSNLVQTSHTSCPPHRLGLPSTAVLGSEAPIVWGDDFNELTLAVHVTGCTKPTSVLSLAGYDDKLLWLASSIHTDSSSCKLSFCLQPEGKHCTLITVRYCITFYNHTNFHAAFAVDPDLHVFTEVAPSSHCHLTEFAEPCRVVVRLRCEDGRWTHVSSLIPMVVNSDIALPLVSVDAVSGAVERTVYMRIIEVDGSIVAALSDFCEVQASVLVLNETTDVDAFVSLLSEEKRIVCPASTVNVSTSSMPPTSSLHVTLRAFGAAPGAPSADCSVPINDVGHHKTVALMGRTMHVFIEPRLGMRHVIISDRPPHSPLFVIGSSTPSVSVELNVPGVGVSCIDAEGRELLYMRLERMWFKWRRADEESFELKILNFQVDGPLGCGPDVIISRAARPAAATGDCKTKALLPALHAVLVRSSSRWPQEVARMQLIRSAIVCMQELRIDVHEAVVYKLLGFLLPFSSVAAEITASNAETFSAADDKFLLSSIRRQLVKMQSQLVCVRLLVIHSISCLVTFTLAPNSDAVLSERKKYLKTGSSSKLLKTVLDIVGVGGIKDANVKINSLRIENLFAPRQQVVATLKTYFTSQLKGGALGFLGSLDALGNPKHLLMGYASAVSDIFIEPAASAVSSPKDVLSSMQHGTTSLLHNVVGSSLGSIASVSDAFSRGISSVTGDTRASDSAKIRSAGEGLKHGAQSLGMGLISGITGVVTKPMEGARAGGGNFSFGGFMKGMASGVIGVVAQPVKGMADMISDVGKGIDSSTARLHGYKSIERLRAARPPSRWLTQPYNADTAIASTFVRLWHGSAAPRPMLAVIFDLIGHSDWRCSVLLWHRPLMRDFTSFEVPELQQLCREKHLSASGSKKDLADRLVASDPSELLFGHLRFDYTLSTDRWHMPCRKDHLGFTHAEGCDVVLAGDGNHRKSVKCLSQADATAVAHFIAKAELNLPVSDQEQTLCYRCKGHH